MNKKSHVIKIVGSVLILLVQFSMAQTIGSTSINQERQSQSGMSVQSFKSYQIDIGSTGSSIETPICVIGDDSFSKEWLQANKEKLATIKAFCLVTNIESEESLKELQGIAPNINMTVANVNWIPMFLKIMHYPVLITKDQVMQ